MKTICIACSKKLNITIDRLRYAGVKECSNCKNERFCYYTSEHSLIDWEEIISWIVLIGLIAFLVIMASGCNKPTLQKVGGSNSDSIRCEVYVKYAQADSIMVTSPGWSGYMKTTHKTIKSNVTPQASPQMWLIQCQQMSEIASDTITLKVYENGSLKYQGTQGNVIDYSLTY